MTNLGDASSTTTVATGDPIAGEGFYSIFAPAGAQSFQASLAPYVATEGDTTVTAGQVVRLDVVLPAALLDASPRPVSVSLSPGGVLRRPGLDRELRRRSGLVRAPRVERAAVRSAGAEEAFGVSARPFGGGARPRAAQAVEGGGAAERARRAGRADGSDALWSTPATSSRPFRPISPRDGA